MMIGIIVNFSEQHEAHVAKAFSSSLIVTLHQSEFQIVPASGWSGSVAKSSRPSRSHG